MYCTLLINNSQLSTRFTTHTKSVLTSIDISVKNVNDIIKKPDPNKAQVHDKISIRMLKLCGYSIKKPVATIFKNCLNERMFPNEWKKSKYSTSS